MHPRHADLDYVARQIGLSLHKEAPKIAARDQSLTRRAVNAWSGYDHRFPESIYLEEVMELLNESRERLAEKELVIARFYARRGAWNAVEGRAEELVRKYPNSMHKGDALSLMAESAAWLGRKEDADQLLAQVQAEHPEQVPRLQRRLKRVVPDGV